jgi:FAD-linked oxidoreductase
VERGLSDSWANWAGNQAATGLQRVHPRGPEEIAEVLRRAVEDGKRVRPVGSGHSFTGIACPDDGSVQVDLSRWADAVSIDVGAGLATVQAGMPLHRLNRLLEAAGLAMTNLGDIDQQTVAGALSTGTHGSGAAYGGLATQIRGLELVLADGSTLTCSGTENPDVFTAARVGLGALGIVSTVTLAVVPLFALRAEEGPMSLDAVLEGFDELASTTDHAEFYWFPHTRMTLVKRNTRVPLEAGLDPLPKWREWWDDEFLSNTVFGGLVALGRQAPSVVRPAARVASRALGSRTFTDVSHRVFTSPRRVRFLEMEYAVPRAALLPVLRHIVDEVDRSDLRIAFPVEVRVAAADDITLSTASGRDSGYIAVHLPADADPTAYFGLVERIVGEVGGRPHWGKLHSLDAAVLAERYPRFSEFLAIRDRLDPAGLFGNAYLDRVLGRVEQR